MAPLALHLVVSAMLAVYWPFYTCDSLCDTHTHTHTKKLPTKFLCGDTNKPAKKAFSGRAAETHFSRAHQIFIGKINKICFKLGDMATVLVVWLLFVYFMPEIRLNQWEDSHLLGLSVSSLSLK